MTCKTCKGSVYLPRVIEGVHSLVCWCGMTAVIDPAPVKQKALRLARSRSRSARG